jgi:hypothetical protein
MVLSSDIARSTFTVLSYRRLTPRSEFQLRRFTQKGGTPISYDFIPSGRFSQSATVHSRYSVLSYEAISLHSVRYPLRMRFIPQRAVSSQSTISHKMNGTLGLVGSLDLLGALSYNGSLVFNGAIALVDSLYSSGNSGRTAMKMP